MPSPPSTAIEDIASHIGLRDWSIANASSASTPASVSASLVRGYDPRHASLNRSAVERSWAMERKPQWSLARTASSSIGHGTSSSALMSDQCTRSASVAMGAPVGAERSSGFKAARARVAADRPSLSATPSAVSPVRTNGRTCVVKKVASPWPSTCMPGRTTVDAQSPRPETAARGLLDHPTTGVR